MSDCLSPHSNTIKKMSTTFDILPSCKEIPSFSDVLIRCSQNFELYLKRVEIHKSPKITFTILSKEFNKSIPFNFKDPFLWEGGTYLWVEVENIVGGTDGYYWENEDLDYNYWRNEIIPKKDKPEREHLNKCIETGFHWNFRRSAGQVGTIDILYGVLSGTLAELTNGIVYSDDSAWDYQRMPIKGQEFLSSYYIPEKEIDNEMKERATKCIEWAKEELNV